MEIRIVARAEIDGFVGLMRAFLGHAGGDVPSDAEIETLLDLAEPAGEGFVFLGAFEGPEMVGIVSVAFAQSTYKAAPFAWCDDLYVRDDRRRGGVGEALMEAAGQLASGRGCSNVLVAAGEGETGALAFYRGCGFAEMPWRVLSRPL
jgi:GNAT superfamily N-acetyltransferase